MTKATQTDATALVEVGSLAQGETWGGRKLDVLGTPWPMISASSYGLLHDAQNNPDDSDAAPHPAP